MIGQGAQVGVYTPPPGTGPFRGAELGPSSSPHSLEAEAPGSAHGGSARGQKLRLGAPRQPGKGWPMRPGQHPLCSVPWQKPIQIMENWQKRENLGETVEFSCPIYQGVRKFFLRSDHTVMPTSFLHQRSSSCFCSSRLSELCAHPFSWTLAQRPSSLWALGSRPGLLLTLPHSFCWSLSRRGPPSFSLGSPRTPRSFSPGPCICPLKASVRRKREGSWGPRVSFAPPTAVDIALAQ